ncbi:MAG: hypothetical protein ACK5L7_11335 [Paludibacteraceae bacterium]
MKKKILVTLAVALLTVSSSFAKHFVAYYKCNGTVHKAYIIANSLDEARKIANGITNPCGY